MVYSGHVSLQTGNFLSQSKKKKKNVASVAGYFTQNTLWFIQKQRTIYIFPLILVKCMYGTTVDSSIDVIVRGEKNYNCSSFSEAQRTQSD